MHGSSCRPWTRLMVADNRAPRRCGSDELTAVMVSKHGHLWWSVETVVDSSSASGGGYGGDLGYSGGMCHP